MNSLKNKTVVALYAVNISENSKPDLLLTTITLPEKFEDYSVILTIQDSSGGIVKQKDLGLLEDISKALTRGGLLLR